MARTTEPASLFVYIDISHWILYSGYSLFSDVLALTFSYCPEGLISLNGKYCSKQLLQQSRNVSFSFGKISGMMSIQYSLVL